MDAPLEKKSQNNCIHDTMYVAVDVFAAWVWIYLYFDHAKWNEQVPFSFSFFFFTPNLFEISHTYAY